MSTDADLPPLGPGAQAVRLSFWFVAALVVLAACAWAGSNIRRIPPDSRAVVLRFGAFVRTQDAGLLIAWPRPFESTLLVPGSARVLEQRIQSLERDPRARAADMTVPEAAPSAQGAAGTGIGTSPGTGAVIGPDDGPPNPPVTPDNPGGPDAAGPDATPPVARLPDALAGSGYVLTGDNGVLQLRATLYYRVVDPYAYVLQQDRLAAALERIVSASAVDVVAQRDLDAIPVHAREKPGIAVGAKRGFQLLNGHGFSLRGSDTFNGARLSVLHDPVGILLRILAGLFSGRAGLGHAALGHLQRGQHRIERADGRSRKRHLNVDTRDFHAESRMLRFELAQVAFDFLREIAAQTLALYRNLLIRRQ
jgi:hypothetical protein